MFLFQLQTTTSATPKTAKEAWENAIAKATADSFIKELKKNRDQMTGANLFQPKGSKLGTEIENLNKVIEFCEGKKNLAKDEIIKAVENNKTYAAYIGKVVGQPPKKNDGESFRNNTDEVELEKENGRRKADEISMSLISLIFDPSNATKQESLSSLIKDVKTQLSHQQFSDSFREAYLQALLSYKGSLDESFYNYLSSGKGINDLIANLETAALNLNMVAVKIYRFETSASTLRLGSGGERGLQDALLQFASTPLDQMLARQIYRASYGYFKPTESGFELKDKPHHLEGTWLLMSSIIASQSGKEIKDVVSDYVKNYSGGNYLDMKFINSVLNDKAELKKYADFAAERGLFFNISSVQKKYAPDVATAVFNILSKLDLPSQQAFLEFTLPAMLEKNMVQDAGYLNSIFNQLETINPAGREDFFGAGLPAIIRASQTISQKNFEQMLVLCGALDGNHSPGMLPDASSAYYARMFYQHFLPIAITTALSRGAQNLLDALKSNPDETDMAVKPEYLRVKEWFDAQSNMGATNIANPYTYTGSELPNTYFEAARLLNLSNYQAVPRRGATGLSSFRGIYAPSIFEAISQASRDAMVKLYEYPFAHGNVSINEYRYGDELSNKQFGTTGAVSNTYGRIGQTQEIFNHSFTSENDVAYDYTISARNLKNPLLSYFNINELYLYQRVDPNDQVAKGHLSTAIGETGELVLHFENDKKALGEKGERTNIFAYVNKDGIWYKALLRRDSPNASIQDINRYINSYGQLSPGSMYPSGADYGFVTNLDSKEVYQFYNRLDVGAADVRVGHKGDIPSGSKKFDPTLKGLVPYGFSVATNIIPKTSLAYLEDVEHQNKGAGVRVDKMLGASIIGKWFDVSSRQEAAAEVYPDNNKWEAGTSYNYTDRYISSWFGNIRGDARGFSTMGYNTVYNYSQNLKEAGTSSTYLSKDDSEFLNYAMASLIYRDFGVSPDSKLSLIKLNSIASITAPKLGNFLPESKLQVSHYLQKESPQNSTGFETSTGRWDVGKFYLGFARNSGTGIGNQAGTLGEIQAGEVFKPGDRLGGLYSHTDMNAQFGQDQTLLYSSLSVDGTKKQIAGGISMPLGQFFGTLRATVFSDDFSGVGWFLGGSYVTESQLQFLLLTSGEATKATILKVMDGQVPGYKLQSPGYKEALDEIKFNLGLYARIKSEGEIFFKLDSKTGTSGAQSLTLVDRSQVTYEAGATYYHATSTGVWSVTGLGRFTTRRDNGLLLNPLEEKTSSLSIIVDYNNRFKGYVEGGRTYTAAGTPLTPTKNDWYVKVGLVYSW